MAIRARARGKIFTDSVWQTAIVLSHKQAKGTKANGI